MTNVQTFDPADYHNLPGTFSFDFCALEEAIEFLAPLLVDGIKLVGIDLEGVGGGNPELTFEFPSLKAFRKFAEAYISPAHVGLERTDLEVQADVGDIVQDYIRCNANFPRLNMNGSTHRYLDDAWQDVTQSAFQLRQALGNAMPHGRDWQTRADSVEENRRLLQEAQNVQREFIRSVDKIEAFSSVLRLNLHEQRDPR